MRRRLTASILALVAGALVLAGVGSVLLIRHNAIVSARQQLTTEAEAIAQHPASLELRRGATGRGRHPICCLPLLQAIGGYQSLTVARAEDATGTFAGLPASLAGVQMPPAALQDGTAISGNRGDLVYALLPLELGPVGRAQAGIAPAASQTAVLVATRAVVPPLTGFWYFVLIALVCLVIAATVAYWLAARFSAPLGDAVAVTERIARGSLDARIAPRRGGVPEMEALGTSINAMGEALGRARDQQRHFLLSVSHDLRTPLTSIRGYAEAITDGAAPDPVVAAAVIGEEAGRLERLVQDLLDLARLDARAFSLQIEQVDLGRAVRTVVDTQAAMTAGPRLVPELPEGEVPALADPDRLAQLLANLVENACRFARHEVRVGAHAAGEQATLWVVDDGPGIPAEDLPLVFQPYFTSPGRGRSDQATSGSAAGTGLGLAIVKELAQAMGGAVRAESPVGPGGGTRVTVRLPSGEA